MDVLNNTLQSKMYSLPNKYANILLDSNLHLMESFNWSWFDLFSITLSRYYMSCFPHGVFLFLQENVDINLIKGRDT